MESGTERLIRQTVRRAFFSQSGSSDRAATGKRNKLMSYNEDPDQHVHLQSCRGLRCSPNKLHLHIYFEELIWTNKERHITLIQHRRNVDATS